MEYIRVRGKNGVYLFTREEFERATDRENEGVSGDIYEENEED